MPSQVRLAGGAVGGGGGTWRVVQCVCRAGERRGRGRGQVGETATAPSPPLRQLPAGQQACCRHAGRWAGVCVMGALASLAFRDEGQTSLEKTAAGLPDTVCWMKARGSAAGEGDAGAGEAPAGGASPRRPGRVCPTGTQEAILLLGAKRGGSRRWAGRRLGHGRGRFASAPRRGQGSCAQAGGSRPEGAPPWHLLPSRLKTAAQTTAQAARQNAARNRAHAFQSKPPPTHLRRALDRTNRLATEAGALCINARQALGEQEGGSSMTREQVLATRAHSRRSAGAGERETDPPCLTRCAGRQHAPSLCQQWQAGESAWMLQGAAGMNGGARPEQHSRPGAFPRGG